MAIVDGTPVNAATTNAALVSKTATTGNTVTGIINLNNTSDVNSGAAVSNPQRAINETFDAVGITGIGDSTRKDYSSNHVVVNGDSRKVAIGRLDAEFAGTGAHAHSGVNGDGTKISAANLENFNNYFAEWGEFTKDSVSGTSTTITTEMSGKTAGGATAAAGVITSAPGNRVIIQDKETEDAIQDAGGQIVYGRITESSGTWTLSYYTNEAGTETAHSLASQNIRVFYREVYTAATRPTIGSNMAAMPSMDFTADVADASETQRGLISTGAQTFASTKTFNVIATKKSDVASSATITSLATATSFVRITGATATELQGVGNTSDGKRVVIWNGSSAIMTVKHENGGASASERIITPSGGDIIILSNYGFELIYDSSASRWVFASRGSASGSGGSGNIEWYSPDTMSPTISVATNGLKLHKYAYTDEQSMWCKIKVPDDYITGTQIFLTDLQTFCSSTTGNFLIKTDAYLVTQGSNATTLGSAHESTNTQQAVSGAANNFLQVDDMDLTDGSGEIDGNPVSAGHWILIRLYRDVTAETGQVTADINVVLSTARGDFT